MAKPSLDELKVEYDKAFQTRKKDPGRWQEAKHAYRLAERALNHPTAADSKPGSPVAQTADASAESD